MDTQAGLPSSGSINGGYIINLGARHSIAMHERNGHWWVAEFRGGCGELRYAGTWFDLYAENLRYCHDRRTGLPCSTPLTPEMLERIERLHRESEARDERILTLPRTVAAAARRCAISVMSRLRRSESKINQAAA